MTQAHNRVAASDVKGAMVVDRDSQRMGHIHDLSIDKTSGQVVFALVAFGGVLGIGERFHAIPWRDLQFDVAIDSYVVPFDRATIEASPSFTHDELADFGAKGSHTARMLAYYDEHPVPPIR